MVRKLFRNKIFVFLMAAAAAAFVFLQFIPQDEALANPPVVREPNWDSAETRALAKRACFDCHSNETVWPWYSNVAPVSWLVQKDVNDGRRHLNFSEWGTRKHEKLDDLLEVVKEGEMPLKIYLVMHPEADFTAAEKQQLLDGFQRTLGGGMPEEGMPGGEAGHEGNDDD